MLSFLRPVFRNPCGAHTWTDVGLPGPIFLTVCNILGAILGQSSKIPEQQVTLTEYLFISVAKRSRVSSKPQLLLKVRRRNSRRDNTIQCFPMLIAPTFGPSMQHLQLFLLVSTTDKQGFDNKLPRSAQISQYLPSSKQMNPRTAKHTNPSATCQN